MTTANKPENLKTNEAHDLGQISIKTLRALVQKIGEWHEKIGDDMLFTNAPHDMQYHYLDGKYEALHDVLMFLTSFKAAEPEIREGMAEFIGPLRRVYIHTQTHDGIDQRTITGTGHHFFHQRREFTSECFQTLDAPDRIPAGGHYGRVFNDDDADWNVFPMTTYRDLF